MRWMVLTMPPAAADRLTIPVFMDEGGNWVADEYERVLRKRTPYRGDILIVVKGIAVGLVELQDVQPEGNKWRWVFRNPRRCVEFPVKCKNGWFFSDEDVTVYPRYMKIGTKMWKKIAAEIGL